jgi:hypothetical protein
MFIIRYSKAAFENKKAATVIVAAFAAVGGGVESRRWRDD